MIHELSNSGPRAVMRATPAAANQHRPIVDAVGAEQRRIAPDRPARAAAAASSGEASGAKGAGATSSASQSRPARRRRSGSHSPGSRPPDRRGCCWSAGADRYADAPRGKAARRGSSQPTAKVPTTLSVSTSRKRPPWNWPSTRDRRSNASVKVGSSAWPSSVRTSPRAVRRNRGAPRRASSAFT